MLPALPTIAAPIEPYAARDPPTGCVSVEQPGVVMFRDWIRSRVGGGDSGILRPCDEGSTSPHHEGRAWDWTVFADDPEDVARVDAVLTWLLASGPSGDHEMFRRAGLRYIIWDREILSSATKEWRPYTGDDHRTHVHFSFGWPGARGETSFYDWLRAGAPDARPGLPPAPPPRPFPIGTVAAGAAFGLVATLFVFGR